MTSDTSKEVLYWAYDNAVQPEACDSIIRKCELHDGETATIGAGGNGIIDKDVRDVTRVQLPAYQGIGATLAGIGLDANNQAWKFNVTHANQTDFLKYDCEGHYKEHIDSFLIAGSTDCRKLTVLLFLSDDFTGGKFFIKTSSEKLYPPQKRGTVLVFPSFYLHGVEPVESGIRRTIVTWLVGPTFV